MHYDRFTRVLHFLFALGITAQLLLSLVMEHPRPGRPGNGFYEAHEVLGAWLFGILIVHWVWFFVRRGPVSTGHLFPWFSSSRRQALIQDIQNYLRHLSRRTLPPSDAPSPLAGAIQGVGLAAATVLAATGCLILIYSVPDQKMAGWLHDVKEIHEAVGPLMWGYLAVHAGAAMLHQLAGHGIIGPMIKPLSKSS